MLEGVTTYACPSGWYEGYDGKCRLSTSGGSTFDGAADGTVWGAGGAINWPAIYGYPEEEWNQLTPGEKELLFFDEPPKWFNRRQQMIAIRDSAISESMALSGATSVLDGNKQNAFQHALWAGKMAMAFGYEDARKWTDAHEERPRTVLESQELYDANKWADLHNNSLGLGYYWQPFGTLGAYLVGIQAQMRCVDQQTAQVGACS